MKNLKLTFLFIILSFIGYSQQPGNLVSPASINGYTTNGKMLITATNGTGITGVPTWTNTIPFSMITGTSSILFSTSSYTNPTWISSLAWSKITGTPTTLFGYGITDGVSNTSSITINGSSQLLSGSTFSVGNLNGSLTSGYAPYAVSSTSLANSNIYYDGTNVGIGTNIPTAKLDIRGQTISGYGNVSTNDAPFYAVRNSLGAPNYYSGWQYAFEVGGGVWGIGHDYTRNEYQFLTNGSTSSNFIWGTGNPTVPATKMSLDMSTGNLTANGFNVSGQTASKVPYLDASKNLVSSTVTPTELSYIGGLTSSAQNQITSNTNSISTNNSAISTLSTNVTANTSSITSLNNLKENIVSGISTLGANNYTVTYSPAITSYSTGFKALITFTAANTTTATINFNGIGVKNIVKGVSDVLVSGDITAGASYWLLYDGTNFVIINSTLVNQKTNFSPSWTGFVTPPTPSYAYYIEQDKFFLVRVEIPVSTGSGTTRSMTLPFTVTDTHLFNMPMQANGAYINGSARIVGGTNVLNFYPSTIGASFVNGQSFYIAVNLTITK